MLVLCFIVINEEFNFTLIAPIVEVTMLEAEGVQSQIWLYLFYNANKVWSGVVEMIDLGADIREDQFSGGNLGFEVLFHCQNILFPLLIIHCWGITVVVENS